jgi:imidazolonepropionase-like amidohydrolase
VGRALDDVVGVARAAGVPIAMGSDACLPWHHGRNAAEVTALHTHGLSPREAILAATAGGARLLGRQDEVGRIAPGLRFDAIVLDVDPSDTRVFAEPDGVRGVFKAGRPVRAHDRFTLAG